MALFSRRQLQRMIDENAQFVPPEHLQEHVRRLNKVRDEYLSTEWEVGLLNAFSKIGTVQHEPALGGSRRLDLLFRSSEDHFEFGADIVTVSDQSLHKRNPVYPLYDELRRRVRKSRITSGGFGIAVGHHAGVHRGRGVRHDLLLPPVGKFAEVIFNADFESFLEDLKKLPSQPREYVVQSASTSVRIEYHPGSRTGVWTGSHLSYTCANVVDDNPLFNALKGKSKQLKGSNYPGPRGVFVCDGGCSMLSTRMNNWAEFSVRDVILEFFRQHRSVSFVVILGLHYDRAIFTGRGDYRLEAQIGVNPRFKQIEGRLQYAVNNMLKHLPKIEANAVNALNDVKRKTQRGRYFGGLTMSGRRIKLSAITILQLLAGELDYSMFEIAHGFDQKFPNPFRRALIEGRVIGSCSVECSAEEDDDWITFEFSEPDPTLTPFRVDRKPPNREGSPK